MILMNEGSNWRKWDLHIHTPSSYDYSYSGEGNFNEEKLVQAWKKKGFVAVAITDHFVIDGYRIKKLQDLAKQDGITVFPGVEFRTDKGDKNVHIISLFPEDTDVIELGNSFKYTMIQEKAKNSENNSTIYWHLDDVVNFTRKQGGLLTVHAGNKASGIDKAMNNDEFFRQIKMEYAEVVDAFEVNNLHSYKGYKETVISYLEKKYEKEFAVIVSSDNHDCNKYETSTNLWIKADPTFEGLKQAFLHPTERIFIGDKPDKVIQRETNPKSIMKSIKIKKKEDARNSVEWFNSTIPLNSSLVSIIGNKGSGKSALSDILGLVNNSAKIESLSFLSNKRFNKTPNHYGKDYKVELTWLDNEKTQLDNLFFDRELNVATSETAQYLPQQYLEDVCTNLDNNVFQTEINKLIFSYISPEKRLNAKSFDEFMALKTEPIEMELKPLYEQIEKINKEIILLEEKKQEEFKKRIKIKKEERQLDLERQLAVKPQEVPRPISSEESEHMIQLKRTDEQIEDLNKEIKIVKEKFERENINHQRLITLKSEILLLINEIAQKNNQIEALLKDLEIDSKDMKIEFTNPIANYDMVIGKIQEKRDSLNKELNSENGLEKLLEMKKSERQSSLELIDNDQKAYQTYLVELKAWEDTVGEIKGSKEIQNSLAFLEAEYEYLNNDLESEHSTLIKQRLNLIKKIYEKKIAKKEVFDEVYKIIETEITDTLGTLNEDIQFKTKIIIKEEKIQALLTHINKRAQSRFQGTEESKKEIMKIVNELNINDFSSVTHFLNEIFSCGIDSDYDQLSKVIRNKNEYYLEVASLKYFEVDYHLSYNGNTLDELSPGERGLMLLVFYLSLSKDEKPIIIDQPEDNLDNQSVYSRLVPCIVAAKKKRQIIVVTHNPNIAIACDAEQVIVADIDKSSNSIRYTAGSIENKVINNKIVEILEGTRPAFRLRGDKYIVK